MLQNPPLRDGRPLANRKLRAACRGWWKAGLHKVKVRQERTKKREEKEAKLVATGKYDDEAEQRLAWKRSRNTSEAFRCDEDGLPRDGAGIQAAEPQYNVKKKTTMAIRLQLKRQKARKEDNLKANAIEDKPKEKSSHRQKRRKGDRPYLWSQ